MRYLLTLLFAALSLNAVGQMPYNPDSNGDYSIGSPDLLSFLGLFSTTLLDSSLTCDYEGTELEELIGGVISQNLILDSVYVEYLLIDTLSTFLPGCPDPVDIEVVLERSYIVSDFSSSENANLLQFHGNSNYLGYSRTVYFSFQHSNGQYGISYFW